MQNDRNFDDLAERFQRKIYGGLKGKIRLAVLWQDLQDHLPGIEDGRPLRILDVGAGLGQLAIRLAALGHDVVVNDLSEEMLAIAREAAEKQGVEQKIQWHRCAFQTLPELDLGSFDVVLCHALMEWLAEPETLLPALKQLLAKDGVLSLSYYNRHSLEYRNLVRGNFNLLARETLTNNQSFGADPGSLTPGNPQYPERVTRWVADTGLSVISTSGVRVFSDYVTNPRGGNAVPEAVIDMELRYSRREPYLWLGRYIHLVLQN